MYRVIDGTHLSATAAPPSNVKYGNVRSWWYCGAPAALLFLKLQGEGAEESREMSTRSPPLLYTPVAVALRSVASMEWQCAETADGSTKFYKVLNVLFSCPCRSLLTPRARRSKMPKLRERWEKTSIWKHVLKLWSMHVCALRTTMVATGLPISTRCFLFLFASVNSHSLGFSPASFHHTAVSRRFFSCIAPFCNPIRSERSAGSASTFGLNATLFPPLHFATAAPGCRCTPSHTGEEGGDRSIGGEGRGHPRRAPPARPLQRRGSGPRDPLLRGCRCSAHQEAGHRLRSWSGRRG